MTSKKRGIIFIFIFLSFLPIEIEFHPFRGGFSFYMPWHYRKYSVVDMSFLLDSPAGRHGFLKVKDGHFYFEDGTRARFWGVNIHSDRAAFPSHKDAEDIAKRLSQLGCNMVRLHFLDNPSPAGIVDSAYSDSRHLSAAQMERLDYFIYQLKKNGIYITFDVLGLSARRFRRGDGIPFYGSLPAGGGIAAYFDENIKALAKEFARELLNHVNPYTKRPYIDEPAIAFIELMNENTIFSARAQKRLPQYYRNKIKDTYSASGGKGQWYEDNKFLFKQESQFLREMYLYLKDIGVKVPIGGSNIPYDNLTLLAESQMDFTDVHVYWDLCDRLDRIHNRALIKQDAFDPATIVNRIAMAKVSGKPLVVTEWGSNWPNDWRAVDIISSASYANLNDWDGMLLYAYMGGWGLSWRRLKNKLYYGTVCFNDPAKMGLFPLAALCFLRGDLMVSRGVQRAYYNKQGIFNPTLSPYRDRLNISGIAYVSRFEKVFRDNGDTKETAYPERACILPSGEDVESDTGEIRRNAGTGVFLAKGERVFFYGGFVKGARGEQHRGIGIDPSSYFATFAVTSLDGRRLDIAGRMLLAAVGRVRNRGQRFTPHATKMAADTHRDIYILNRGSEPIEVEDVSATVHINKRSEDDIVTVYALDKDGRREKTVEVYAADRDTVYFKVLPRYQTIYYEIIRERVKL